MINQSILGLFYSDSATGESSLVLLAATLGGGTGKF